MKCMRHRFDFWVGKIPRRRKWQPTPVFLLGNHINRGASQAIVQGVAKNWTKLSARARTHTHTHTHTHWNDGWEMGHRRSDAQGSHHKFSSIRRWSDFLPHTHPQREIQCFTIVQWSVACRLRCKKHVNECTNISMYTYIGICTYTHMYAGIQNRGLNKSCEYSWDIDGKVD